MDIGKMSTGDISFSAPLNIGATRNDFIHALVAYFDVMFSKCHKTTGFSTGLCSSSLYYSASCFLEFVCSSHNHVRLVVK